MEPGVAAVVEKRQKGSDIGTSIASGKFVERPAVDRRCNRLTLVSCHNPT
jgi:hypothetical protein